MRKWHKIVIVVISGGAVWGLTYGASMFPEYSFVVASFATGITALSSMLTGFPAKDD